MSEIESEGFEFIATLLRDLNISYTISGKDKMRIPSEGRLIIVSNHPLGGLDALILINAISEIRTDVKVLANNVLLKYFSAERSLYTCRCFFKIGFEINY